jgi:hypothetical protein
MARRMITYPTNRLLGVIDDAARTAPAIEALAEAGFAPGGSAVLVGQEGRDHLGRLGHDPNALSRLVRLLQFTLMDQTPDFLVYERAIAEGRAVVAVNVADRDRMLAAAMVLERHGAHFLNYFGRLSTEEVSMWRGEEVDLPDPLRR